MSEAPIVGIDLGTTNSLAAVCDARGPRVLAGPAGDRLVPSVVRFEPAGGVVVGADAKVRAHEFPGQTVSSVKRLMGRGLADAAADLPFLPFEVVEGEHSTARVRLPDASAPGGARVVSPQEVSAHVLRELKRRASAALGVDVTRAVVTVPAYFDDAQRQATRDAGRLAGLDVVRIVNEPTAAALAYGLGAGRSAQDAGPRVVAVYDLGGGTFDVSILKITPSPGGDEPAFFQVLSTAGDTRLGGDDIDNALTELFIAAMRREGLLAGDTVDPQTRARLKAEAERVKIRLSDHQHAEVTVEIEGRAWRGGVTRSELERLIEPLARRTLASCERASRDASRAIPPTGVDAVVLVGGATRTPMIRKMVGEFFGREPYTAVDPDEAVALGAAVQGWILGGSSREALLLDVVPLSLGIETVGGAAAKIIMRNATVPTRAREMFSTSVDGQTSIRLNVLQGEREMAADCRSLGVFALSGIPPMPAGMPQVEVEFLVDANGVLNVSARERRSGAAASLQVIPNHGLTRDEVDRMEREALEHAREDMRRHRVVDLAASGRLDLKWIGESLARVGDQVDPAYRSEIEGKLVVLRMMIEMAERDWRMVDPESFHRAKTDLEKASQRLQELAVTAALRAGADEARKP